jgi:hypothetical protein
MLRLGERIVSLIDTGDGAAAAVFAKALVDAGATTMDSETESQADLRIVIRSAAQSPEASLRAELLEEAADLVLGSARPVFARVFGSACARWVNS